MKPKTPLTACRAAFARQFIAIAPDIPLDKNGYTADASLNLVGGISLSDFEADLRQGDGNELENKFRAVHSSSALAVNNFAPFKARIGDLVLPSGARFSELQFERKCHHGLAGRKPPNLDVLAEGSNQVTGIESKCHEYLSPHIAEFAPAYKEQILDKRRDTGWFLEMLRLDQNPRHFRWLNAAQLIKHAFGLGHTFPGHNATLLYLFWEPANAASHPIFAEHRAEIADFAVRVGQGGPKFQAMSYPELWSFWENQARGDWLTAHIARMRQRYNIPI